MFFMKFIEWLKAFTLVQKISMGVAATVVVGGCATTVVCAGAMNKRDVRVVAEASTTAVREVAPEPSKEDEPAEETSLFTPVKITASSIEKDLDIFFLDNENKKIKGQQFSVKLVSVTDAAKLNPYVDAIGQVNEEIQKVEEASGPDYKRNIAELNKKKENAIAEYTSALKGINGTIYTDDNQDGRITQKKLEPGDFSLCYVPTAEYDASDYTQKTTVKDVVEYKPVEDIEERVVTAEEAGDTEPVHEEVVKTEVVPEDTVEYVQSTKTEEPAVFEQSKSVELKAATSDPTDLASIGAIVDKQVDLYPSITNEGKTVINVSAGVGDKITAESQTEGITATVKGSQITITADANAPKDTTTGKISVKITKLMAGNPGAAEPESSSAASSAAASSAAAPESSAASSEASKESSSAPAESTTPSSSAEEKSSEATTKSEAAPSSSSSATKASSTSTSSTTPSSTGSTTPSSSGTSGTGVTGTKEQVIDIEVKVTVHGTQEQLKDEKDRELFRDDKGSNAATIEDYSSTATFFYQAKAAGATSYTGWQTLDGAQYYFDKNGNKVTGTQVIRGVKYKFGTDGALLTSGIGIDVSKWQGSIDWSAAKSSISFAIIRAGFRGTSGGIAEDDFAVTNIRGCNANGIRCGLYVYSRATTKAQAVEEATLAINVAKKGGSISLPIFIDMESEEQRANPETQNDVAIAFLNTVRNAGYSAGVYASKSWIESYLDPDRFGAFTMWVAQYNVTCNYKGHYDIWQYSSNGDIPGIETKVDMNEGKF